MTIEEELNNRSGGKCEFCGSNQDLSKYEVPPVTARTADKCVFTCETCSDQINHPEKVNVNHWRCLNDCMWSEVPAVQVMSLAHAQSIARRRVATRPVRYDVFG